MKTTMYKAMFAVTALLLASTVHASSASIPNEFTAGEAAVAAEVNENFNSLATAINDNDTRITALEANPAPVTSYVSIPAHGMHSYREGCLWSTNPGSTFGEFDSGDTTNQYCELLSAPNLPHGATLESLSCTVFDNDSDANGLRGALRRIPLDASTNTPEQIYSTSLSIDSVEPSVLTDSTAAADRVLIDNENYAYYVHVSFPDTTDTVGSNLKVYGCSVSFSK